MVPVVDVEALGALEVPILLSDGDETVPWLRLITHELSACVPSAARWTFTRSGHVPHLSTRRVRGRRRRSLVG